MPTIMETILKSLLKTVILLVCSVIQVFEAIFMGIGMMFEGIANILDRWSSWLMRKFTKGKYEGEKKAIAK